MLLKGTVDPEAILNALSPLLDQDGILKGQLEAKKAVNCMQQSSKHLVSATLCLQILRDTEDATVLTKFLSMGGWQLLYEWLRDFKDEEEQLQLLLAVYAVMPITTELLKANKAAKAIKSLFKHPNEEISKTADEIVNSWMKIVREKAAEDKKEKRNAKKESKAESSPEDNSENGKSDSASSSKLAENRPKTVKVPDIKFRNHGITDDILIPKKKQVAKPSIPIGIKRTVNAVQDAKEAPPDKKSKTDGVDEVLGKIKIITPKPKASEVHESSGFMNALTAPTPAVQLLRRKRKGSATKVTPTSPTSPTVKPPAFYKDLLASPTADSAVELFKKDEPEEESVPSTGPSKKPKKSVTWKPDAELKEMFYFELDETERVNVNQLRVKAEGFDAMKKAEMMQDRQAFQSMNPFASGTREGSIIEKRPWKPLILLTLNPPKVEPGSRSNEYQLQKARQLQALQPLYFSRAGIPDAPLEPDPEQNNDDIKCRTIPLESVPLPSVTEPVYQNPNQSQAQEPPQVRLPDSLMNSIQELSSGKGSMSLVNAMASVASTVGNPVGPNTNFQPPMNPGVGNPNFSQPPHPMGGGMDYGPRNQMGPNNDFPPPPMNQGNGHDFQPNPGFMPRGMPPTHQPPPFQPNFRGPPPPSFRPRGRGGNVPPRRSTPCRHFLSPTGCRFGSKCSFLHPGSGGQM